MSERPKTKFHERADERAATLRILIINTLCLLVWRVFDKVCCCCDKFFYFKNIYNNNKYIYKGGSVLILWSTTPSQTVRRYIKMVVLGVFLHVKWQFYDRVVSIVTPNGGICKQKIDGKSKIEKKVWWHFFSLFFA